MKFTFAESVKLATKGFKPGDISELSELDENKFGKDDILSLVANGYSKSDIKKLVDTFSDHDSEDDQNDDSDDNDDHDDKPDKKKHVQDDPEDDDSDDNDNIDYKDLYEKEKKLREKLQQQNQKKGSEVKGDNKTDFDIALDIANNL